jgi:hypothetical protein
MRRIGFVAVVVLLLAAGTVGAQTETPDPVSFIGLSLDGLVGRYGAPQSVYAARGLEEWQDDVIFVYSWADLYVYRDHVWQAAVRSMYGIRTGDPKAAALLVLGEAALDNGSYLVCPIRGYSWPIMMRCNLDSSGKISAIYLYRSDL